MKAQTEYVQRYREWEKSHSSIELDDNGAKVLLKSRKRERNAVEDELSRMLGEK
jgi:hypothetical protein